MSVVGPKGTRRLDEHALTEDVARRKVQRRIESVKNLDEYQRGLVVKFVQAARRGQTERREFTYYEAPIGSRPVFRDQRLRKHLQIGKADLDALAGLGLIAEQSHVAGMGHIRLTQLAFDMYDHWAKQSASSPKQIGF